MHRIQQIRFRGAGITCKVCTDDPRFEKEKGRDNDPVVGEIEWDVVGERVEDDATFETQNDDNPCDGGKESTDVLCDQGTIGHPPQSS